MSLRDLAAEHSKGILALHGDSATITAPASLGGAVYACHALVQRSGVTLSPDGFPVPEDTTVVTISLGELADLGLSSPETLKTPGWTVTTTDVTGATISGTIKEPLLDRTLGRVTFNVKRSS